MQSSRNRMIVITGFILAFIPACGSHVGGKSNESIKLGKYELIATMTDDAKQEKCRANAEDILVKHKDIKCMVGLWAYNPPAMLAAVKDADKTGQIAIVGFDEYDETLQGIEDGHIYATVVQQPYQFGYEAIRILSRVVRGDRSVLPEDGIQHIPHQVIKADNVKEFRAKVAGLKEPDPTLQKSESGSKDEEVHLAFISNNPYEFWTFARRGTEKAAVEFNANVEFMMPPRGTAAEQRQIIEDLQAKGVQGIAISPIDGENQADFLNTVAEKIPLVTQDSDLPEGSKRLCFIGTHNYEAGKAAGELVKEVLPEGGKIVIFVGRMDVSNAIERRQGVMDALAGK